MAHPERADVRVRRSDADEPAAAVVTAAHGVALSGGAVAQVLDLAVVGRQKVTVVSNPARVCAGEDGGAISIDQPGTRPDRLGGGVTCPDLWSRRRSQ